MNVGPILRPHLAPVVDSGGRNACMPEPFLDFGAIRIVIEGVYGGRFPLSMRTDATHVDLDGFGIPHEHVIYAIWRN